MQTKSLGLIAGNGQFPLLFAQKARNQNYKVIAAGIKGDTSLFLRFFVDKCAWFQVGDLKKLFTFFKQSGVKQVMMAGQVNPNNLFEKDVAFDDEPWIRRGKKGRRYMLGYTIGGRYLFVVYVVKGGGIAGVVTAMDMDDKTRNLYRKKGKRGKQ